MPVREWPEPVTVMNEGTVAGIKKKLNFIGGNVNAVDNQAEGRVDVTLTVPAVEVQVQDEGVLAGARGTLNFVGEGVAAVDNPAQDRVDVTANGDVIVQDEGIVAGTRRRVNFIGAGVTAVDNAPQNRVDVTIPGGGVNPETSVDMIEEFLSGSSESGEIGTHGWGSAGTNPLVGSLSGVADHPGFYRVIATATLNNETAILLNEVVTSVGILFGMTDLECIFIVRTVDNAVVRFRVGFDTDIRSAAVRDLAEFEFDTSLGDVNWMCLTGQTGVGVTRTNSGIAVVAGTWYKLRILRNAVGNWEFYIGGVLVATNVLTLPTAANGTNVGAGVKTLENVIKTLDVDFARIRVTVVR